MCNLVAKHEDKIKWSYEKTNKNVDQGLFSIPILEVS